MSDPRLIEIAEECRTRIAAIQKDLSLLIILVAFGVGGWFMEKLTEWLG